VSSNLALGASAIAAANPTAAQIEAVARLEAAINVKDADGVEAALADAYGAGVHLGPGAELQAGMCSLLISLLNAPWHIRHEDVALSIQSLRCTEAVPALEEAAHAVYEYLSYDDFFGLARKCTRALADIGTPEARAALERLSNSSNAVIAGYAARRLARWERELDRKRR
jgi:hypothetical protein